MILFIFLWVSVAFLCLEWFLRWAGLLPSRNNGGLRDV